MASTPRIETTGDSVSADGVITGFVLTLNVDLEPVWKPVPVTHPIPISFLAGYPSDGTKALFGDGAWKVPVGGGGGFPPAEWSAASGGWIFTNPNGDPEQVTLTLRQVAGQVGEKAILLLQDPNGNTVGQVYDTHLNMSGYISSDDQLWAGPSNDRKWGTLPYASGGQEFLSNTSVPVDGIVDSGMRVQWYDATIGDPKLRFKERDLAGTLFEGVAGASPIVMTSVPVTSAELKTAHDPAKVLLPAPGGRKYYLPISIVIHYRFGTTPYTGTFTPGIGFGTVDHGLGNYMPFGFTGAGPSVNSGAIFAQAEDCYQWGQLPQYPWLRSEIENLPLFLTNAAADIAAGDGTATIRVFYALIDGAP